jgi:hypothetical protein
MASNEQKAQALIAEAEKEGVVERIFWIVVRVGKFDMFAKI